MPTAAPVHESPFQRWSRRAALYVLAPLLVLAMLPVSVHILQKPDLGLAVHRLRIQQVAPEGPAARAGLQPGDQVVAVGERPIASMTRWHALMAGDYSLTPRRITVRRAGADAPVTVTITPRRPTRSRMVFNLSIWLAGLSFLMIGWWVHGARHDAVGRNFFGLCLVFAFFLADVPDLPSAGYQAARQMVRELLQYLWPVYFLRFFLMFPATGSVTSGRGGRLLFVPALALMAVTTGAVLAGVQEDSRTATLLQGAAQIYFLGYFAAGLGVFARKVLRRDRPVLHTKLRVILLGILGGVLPFLVAAAVGGGVLPAFGHWEYLGFSLLLVPVSFGLAIMRYGALDTAFVVRTSVVYGLLTALVLTGYVACAGILGSVLARTHAVSAYPVLVLAVAATSLAVLPLRRRVQLWVDATLYPSRRADRDAVLALGRALAVQTGAADAHDMLLDRLHHLFRPTRLALYLRTNGDLDADSLVEADRRPDTDPPGPALPADGPVATFLDRLRRPVFLEEFDDWAHAPGRPRPAPAAVVVPPDAELLVPLVTGNRLLGVLAFGPKSRRTLYSQEDLANLGDLALQAAPILESLRLHEATLRQRQIDTELAVARDIQSQLLPTGPLVIGNVEICGRNAPCRQVGGDYFDYFPLDPGRTVGFCIADVAGKGIPAALLMTTLRVTFRELARPDAAPEAVLGELDRRLTDLLSAGRFVSFFYGVVDLPRRLLTYCNAGLEPPLLLRRDGPGEYLRRGGPVLGIGAGLPYRRGQVRLAPGDTVLGYTDGITEQTSPDGEDFFETDRLEAAAAAGSDQAPEALCRHIFSRVEAFGGTDASDDRTVIVLRCN
jgi:sigma-B regulation protein RsbU (phosphoserine phosphatase)